MTRDARTRINHLIFCHSCLILLVTFSQPHTCIISRPSTLRLETYISSQNVRNSKKEMNGLTGSHVFFRSPPTPGRGGKMSVLARSVKYASRARSFSIRPRRASERESERAAIFRRRRRRLFFYKRRSLTLPRPHHPRGTKNKTEYLPQEFPCFRPRVCAY